LRLNPAPAGFFLTFPGNRLTSIISDAPQREADRQHEERSDFVDRHRLERRVAIAETLHRVRGLDRYLQPVADDFGEARNAGTAAGRIDAAQPTRGPAGG